MKIDSRLQPNLVGTIDLSTEPILEESDSLLYLPNNIGLCDIRMYSDERTIPHFHIIPKSRICECCICIYKPLYFNHCCIKQLRLNSKQRKILNDWSSSPSNYHKAITNWDVVDILWKGGNDFKYVPEDPHQPDYINMEYMRS